MGRGLGCILSTLKIKQKGFCPKKGFCPSWKIYRRDSVHLVKMNGRDYIHVAKNMGGIMSTYTKMSRRDYVREGFCPTLLTPLKNKLYLSINFLSIALISFLFEKIPLFCQTLSNPIALRNFLIWSPKLDFISSPFNKF